MSDSLDQKKVAQTAYPLHDLLAHRWSPRAFGEGDLTREQVGSLLEAARWSASSFNEQPWRFVYALRHEDADGFNRILATLMERNQMWARRASLLMICSALTVGSRGVNSKAVYDTGQAVANLSTQATAMGLHVHQMGGFSGDAARTALDLPAEWEPVVAVAVGVRAAPETLPELFQPMETSERERLALPEFAFSGTAATPTDLG